MDNEKGQSKVYLDIVKEIKRMIHEEGLKAGDKIPSERELSERLNVGRSSVREAFRALELLGLIETRRGEGTFLVDLHNHQLIKWLGMFILDDPRVKKDVLQTKKMIDENMIYHLCTLSDKSHLQAFLQNQDPSEYKWEKLIDLAENRLLVKIWHILHLYANEIKQQKTIIDKPFIQSLIHNEIEKATSLFFEWNEDLYNV